MPLLHNYSLKPVPKKMEEKVKEATLEEGGEG